MVPAIAHTLIVITSVYYGSVVSMHDFTTKAACETAMHQIESEQRRVGVEGIQSLSCVPK